MTNKEVANILLCGKAKYSSILSPDTRAKLGNEGFAYAIDNNWLELDEATQCVQLTQRATTLAEIKLAAMASIERDVTAQKSSAGTRNSRAYDLMQANTPPASAEVVCESAPSVVAKCVETTWTAAAAFNVRQGFRLSEAAAEEYRPGDQVVIGEDGQQYYATVQAKQPDGSLVLSFGAKKPSKIKTSYSATEVAKTAAGAASEAPKLPGQQVSGGPAAPGLSK